MTIKTYVQNELKNIHRTRNRIGYLPNPLSLIVSIYFQREALAIDNRWWAALVLVALGSVIRIVVNEIFFDEWRLEKKWARRLSFFGFFAISLGWSLHFSDVVYHYGPNSNHVSYVLLIIIAFIAGGSTSLLADRVSYYTFVGTLTLGVISTYIGYLDFSNAYIILNVFLYLMFSLSNYKISHKQLCELLESQIVTRMEKERLDGIINTVPGFVGLMDKDLKVYMANQATLTLYPGIIGKTIGTIDPTSNWEQHLIDFQKSDRHADVQEHSTMYGGQEITAVLNVQKTADGGLIVVSIVITELKEAQKKIREQEAKAYYSAKLASLGQMAAGIAHEVNNPLTIIQGSANIISRMVETEPIDVANVKLLTTKLIDTSNRISRTIKSLKALSRNGETDPMVKVPVKEILDICVELSSQKFKQTGVELKVSDIPDRYVIGREVQLSQVMVNLLNNSIDAIKDKDNSWIRIEISESNNFICIDVIDSGKGIPKDVQVKMMEPFFTTKDVNQGTGLGLSISKNIIQEHGGELLYVDNAPNTTFRIKLPLA